MATRDWRSVRGEDERFGTKTVGFGVFRLEIACVTSKWVAVTSLGDSALFVGENGENCTRTVVPCTGSGEWRGNCVYFTDLDSDVFGRDGSSRGCDQGVFCLGDRTIMPLIPDGSHLWTAFPIGFYRTGQMYSELFPWIQYWKKQLMLEMSVHCTSCSNKTGSSFTDLMLCLAPQKTMRSMLQHRLDTLSSRGRSSYRILTLRVLSTTKGFTPLHLASANGHLAVVKGGSHLCLLRDEDGLLPVHTAAINGKVRVLEELMSASPELVRARTCLEDSIVHLGVRFCCFDVVKLLIEKLDDEGDYELLKSRDANGNTILNLAAARKQLEMLKLLLGKPWANVNATNSKGSTILDVLLESPCKRGDLRLGEMIRAAGGRTADELGEEMHQSPQAPTPTLQITL